MKADQAAGVRINNPVIIVALNPATCLSAFFKDFEHTMTRFDRALAILLLLRSGKTVSAPDLGQRLGVSVRTIYRDMETLAEVGVPIYAETGREGGFRLVEGYFIPPIAFTVGEATSLLTGLALLDRLRTKPFAAELDTATHKLLAAVPDSLRDVLSQAQRVIGFEAIPDDIFHPERSPEDRLTSAAGSSKSETQAITVFLKCIFEKRRVSLDYASPYKAPRQYKHITPYGILWDRDRWYLMGQVMGREAVMMWRADRVVIVHAETDRILADQEFSIESRLNRQWLREAMISWAQMSPVVIRMTSAQAARLTRDWYYGHALFETLSDDVIEMTFGESNQAFVFELLRWLGPGAELVEPHSWRQAFAAELQTLLRVYEKN